MNYIESWGEMSNRFIIKRLCLKNFKCFDNTKFYEFNFEENSNLIVLSGPNGFGKTTFFDAIELFFRKEITRFKNDIEGTKQKESFLIHDVNYNAYLYLELIDPDNNKEMRSFLIQIDNSKVTLKRSLESIKLFQCLGNVDLQNFVFNIELFEEIDSLENSLNTTIEDFNMFYYISQAESTHFLKQSIKTRKDIMDKLLGIEDIVNKSDRIRTYFIGDRTASAGTIKKYISDNEKKIEETKRDLSETIKNLKTKTNIDYFSFFGEQVCEKNPSLDWDKKTFDTTKESIDTIFGIIDNYFYAINSFEDYKVYQGNKEIDKIITQKTTLSNFIVLQDLLSENFLQESIIVETINVYNTQETLHNISTMIDTYKKVEQKVILNYTL